MSFHISRRVPLGGTKEIRDMSVRPDGKHIAFALTDINKYLISNENFDVLKEVSIDAENPHTCVFSPDSHFLAYNDGTNVVLLDENLKETARFNLENAEYYFYALVWAPDSSVLAVWGISDKSILILDTSGEVIDSLQTTGEGKFGRDLVWLNDSESTGRLVVLNVDKEQIEVYPLKKQATWRFERKNPDLVIPIKTRSYHEIIGTPGNKIIFHLDANGIKIVDLETQKIYSYEDDGKYIGGRAQVSPDNSKLVWGISAQVMFFDFQRGKFLGTDRAGSYYNYAVSYHPCGNLFFVCGPGKDSGFCLVHFLPEDHYLYSRPAKDFNSTAEIDKMIDFMKTTWEINSASGPSAPAVDLGIGGKLLGFGDTVELADGASDYEEVDIRGKILAKMRGQEIKEEKITKKTDLSGLFG